VAVSSIFCWWCLVVFPEPSQPNLSWSVWVVPNILSLYQSTSLSQALTLAVLFWNACDVMSVNIYSFTTITTCVYFIASLSMYINQAMLMLPTFLMQMPRQRTPHTKSIFCPIRWHLQNKRKPQWILFMSAPEQQMHYHLFLQRECLRP